MSREESIYHQASALPPAQRAAFLDQACAGDNALRDAIEQLLSAAQEADEFFASPVLHRRPVIREEGPGDRIGRYKLLQQIGRGGCGVVYMAEQEEPVRRRVALKVIKLGMDTQEVIARFEGERQALALMDHPNIARVLDAGATKNGRPFFVMELVRGIPITNYCDQHNLSTEERLKLFVGVCHAIQHAHEKGVVHRDIKPTNILVTMHDDVAVPKVIDFGIAKATQGRLTDHTVFTAFEQFLGTPAYMSPEQAQLNDLEVDPRSDIYSLGVLLYELLSGCPPFDPKTLQQCGIDEIRRIIREVDPPRPSTRFNTLDEADRSTVAKRRGTAPAHLSTQVSGDLDWIAMKALEKNRTRRYDSATALALDIKRYLGNEPVIARPPSAAYRLKKFTARNSFGLIAGATAIVSLAAGLMFSRFLSGWGEVSVAPNHLTKGKPAASDGHGPLIRILVSSDGREPVGVLSPDETRLASVDWKPGGGAVTVKDLQTGVTTTLASPATPNSYDFATSLVWSPDSEQLAYSWCEGAKNDLSSLRILSARGGKPRIVRVNEVDMGFCPFDWSRDGKWLLGEFNAGDRSSQLATIAVDSGELRVITPPFWPRANHARFSPDGKLVVFARIADGNRNVFLLTLETARITRFTGSTSPAEDGTPVFSSDERYILFSSNRGGTWDLWGAKFENGRPIAAPFLVKHEFGDCSKRVTAAGKLVFVITAGEADVYEVEASANANAHGPIAITNSYLGRHASPAWSPDGKRIAYVRIRGEAGRQTLLCIRSRDDGREETIETGLEYLRRIFWAPDGKFMVLTGQGAGNEIGIYGFSLESRERVPISVGSGLPSWPIEFSPDGSDFMYYRDYGRDRVVFDFNSRQARSLGFAADQARIATAPDLAREIDYSRDLSSIVFVTKDNSGQQLVVADAALQNRKTIAHVPSPASISAPRWARDGGQVAYYVTNADQKKEVRVVASDGSGQRILNLAGREIANGAIGPSWSPDGSKVALTLKCDASGEIGVLEGFLPVERIAAK